MLFEMFFSQDLMVKNMQCQVAIINQIMCGGGVLLKKASPQFFSFIIGVKTIFIHYYLSSDASPESQCKVRVL